MQDAKLAVDALGGIRHTALVATPEGNGWVLDGSGGRLESAGRTPLDVENFRVRFQQGVVYLTDASLRLGPNGTLAVSGEIGGPDAPFDMQAQWQGVAAADVLDATWKKRLSGVLREGAHRGRRGQPALTTGNFRLADGTARGLARAEADRAIHALAAVRAHAAAGGLGRLHDRRRRDDREEFRARVAGAAARRGGLPHRLTRRARGELSRGRDLAESAMAARSQERVFRRRAEWLPVDDP